MRMECYMMAKVRQDAWAHEDDLRLAETVLRHIREGSTQLNALEEAGDDLNRTSAACGFRWNAEVRNEYSHAIEVAKIQRKQKKRPQAADLKTESHNHKMREYEHVNEDVNLIMAPDELDKDLTRETVIAYLRSLSQDHQQSSHIRNKVDKLQIENRALLHKISELENTLKLKEKRLIAMEEDYQTFIQIMDRARKMTVLDDHQSESAPSFRMDKNGNLEQVAQSHSNCLHQTQAY